MGSQAWRAQARGPQVRGSQARSCSQRGSKCGSCSQVQSGVLQVGEVAIPRDDIALKGFDSICNRTSPPTRTTTTRTASGGTRTSTVTDETPQERAERERGDVSCAPTLLPLSAFLLGGTPQPPFCHTATPAKAPCQCTTNATVLYRRLLQRKDHKTRKYKTPIHPSSEVFAHRVNHYSQLSPSIRAPTRNNNI